MNPFYLAIHAGPYSKSDNRPWLRESAVQTISEVRDDIWSGEYSPPGAIYYIDPANNLCADHSKVVARLVGSLSLKIVEEPLDEVRRWLDDFEIEYFLDPETRKSEDEANRDDWNYHQKNG